MPLDKQEDRLLHVDLSNTIYIYTHMVFTSYGRFLELIKLSLNKSQHQAGLAYSHVTQQHQFELADLGLR